MSNMNFYHPISPIEMAGSDSLDELKVSVGYDKNAHGVYLQLKPVHRGNYVESCYILSGVSKENGLKLMVKPLNRKSQKQLDNIANRIEPLVPIFAEKWNTEDFQGITEIVKKAM